jgi:hypothetical protein
MKTYAFNTLTFASLAEIATLRYEPSDAGPWDDLAGKELTERERTELGFLTEKLRYYKSQRANEATVWARAIYPLLVLAERGSIRAFSAVPLAATFDDIDLRGEADGALAESVNEDIGLPYVVIIEAKRSLAANDPMPQLLGAMLCAARQNEKGGHPAHELFGCYTIADVWTFVRCQVDWSQPRPSVQVTASREYSEKTEAPTILSILESIVGKIHP